MQPTIKLIVIAIEVIGAERPPIPQLQVLEAWDPWACDCTSQRRVIDANALPNNMDYPNDSGAGGQKAESVKL